MPAPSQASSCAKDCVNTRPFAWIWSNYKCFNLQPAQRPGASLHQALWRHRCLLWPEMPHVLVPWTWGALSDILQSCSESCLQVSRQLHCCSLAICQCWRALSTTVRSGYCGRILYTCNKRSLLGPPKDPLQQNGKELLFKLQLVSCISQVNRYSFVTPNRHYFYTGIHCVVFLYSNQNKGRIAASLGVDICMVHYKLQIRLIHSANPTSYHLCMVN